LPSVNGIRYRELAGHEPPFSGSLNRDGDIRLPTESEKARGTGPPNILGRAFVASAPNQQWIAHFTYIHLDGPGVALCGGSRWSAPHFDRTVGIADKA